MLATASDEFLSVVLVGCVQLEGGGVYEVFLKLKITP